MHAAVVPGVVALLIASGAWAQAEPVVSAQAAQQRPLWRLPPDRYVQVLGHRIHYYEKGAGPVLLLVHGFGGSAAREWGRVIDLLAAHHRVIALHQIGFAPSEQPQIVYNTAAFVDHLAEFIRVLDLRSVVLIGGSFGGWVVASYAVLASHPGSTLPQIAKLVIADGAIGLTDPPPPGARNFFDAQVQLELREFAHPRYDNAQTIASAMQQSGLMKNEPSESALSGIRVPTLIMWGDKDEVVPLELGRKLARAIPKAQMTVFANAGHISSVEVPIEFARTLTQFADQR